MNYNRYRVRKTAVPSDPSAAYSGALQCAYNILSYRDNTEKQLRDKLAERGYGYDTVNAVIMKVRNMGFLDEERMMYGMVRSLAVYKRYGMARIKRELSAKEFSADVIKKLSFDSEEVSDIDFGEICYELLKKKGGSRDKKTYSFLIRYGHSSEDIREAYRRIEKENADAGD